LIKTVKVAVGQLTPICFEPEKNVTKICAMMEEAASQGAEMIVFGEMAVSGYPGWRPDPIKYPYTSNDYYRQLNEWESKQLFYVSETVPGPSTEKICKKARECKIQTVVGIGEADPLKKGVLYNTAVLIDAQGRLVGKNQKVHIYQWEYFYWQRGGRDSIKVHQTDLGKIGILICYDTMFPEQSQLLNLMGQEIQCQVYAGSDGWEKSIVHLAPVRAMEGGIFVLAANLAGKVGDALFKGASRIVDPFGEVLAEAGEQEEIIYANIDLNKIIDYRASGALVNGLDRRDDLYDLRLK